MITRSQKNKFQYHFLSDNFFTSSNKKSKLIQNLYETEDTLDTTTESYISTDSTTVSINEQYDTYDSDETADYYSENDSDIQTNLKIKSSKFDNEYKLLQDNLYSIMDGTFFDQTIQDYPINYLKSKLSMTDVQYINNEISNLKTKYQNKNLDILHILNMNITDSDKNKILEKIYFIMNCDILSSEYINHISELNNMINKSQLDNNKNLKDELKKLENQINQSLVDHSLSTDNYKYRILTSNMSLHNKIIAYKNLKIMQSYGNNHSSEEYIKYKTWIDTLLNIPFNTYYHLDVNYSCLSSIKTYINNFRYILDKELSFLEKPKDQIINIISQLLRNPDSNINAIGLYGNKGLGKTQFVECIARALNRPLVRISLGGNSDATTLKGHNFTYIGSKPGKIIDGLIHSKIMNPIIFFDEIDKISNTEQGKEITGTLIHLIDLTTNNKYNGDEYFSGIEFDLSRALFMFTYNNPNLIDPILADRIYKIHINNYTISEKIEITHKHLITNILNSFNYTSEDIIFEDDTISYIVEKSKYTDGMRSIKNQIQLIISRINTLLLTDKENNIVNLNYKKLYSIYKELPIVIKKEHIDILIEKEKNNITYPHMYL